MSLETKCLLKLFQLHYCPDNDAKSMVKHLIFLRKFAVVRKKSQVCGHDIGSHSVSTPRGHEKWRSSYSTAVAPCRGPLTINSPWPLESGPLRYGARGHCPPIESKQTWSYIAFLSTIQQTFCYAPIFMADARFAIKLILCGIKKQFQVLLRIFYLPWSNGFGSTTMGNKWLLGKCPILVT